MRLILALLALPLALVAASPAAAGPSAPAAALVIKVKSVTVASIPRDTPPIGVSKGDRILVRDNLVNVSRQFGKPVGAVVGHDEAVYTYTSKTSAKFSGVATLPGGTIRLHGSISWAGGAVAPVIVDGGTGRYAGARGRLVIGAGKTPLNTYRLTVTKAPAASGGCPACSA